MWIAGDLLFFAAIVALAVAWMRQEERDAPRVDARVAVAAARDRTARSRARRAARGRAAGCAMSSAMEAPEARRLPSGGDRAAGAYTPGEY